MAHKIKFVIGALICKFAPIKKGRYVFTSFSGHYSDNTKYISIKLHELDDKAEIVWLLKKEYFSAVPSYVKAIDIDSLKSYWYRGTAQAQIDNVYGYRAQFLTSNDIKSKLKYGIINWLLKKNQPIFATMHGTAIKRIGRDQIGNSVLDMSCPKTYLLLGDTHTEKVLQRVTFYRIPTQVLGAPRNDLLFSDTAGIREKLGLPTDKKIILFAPTFRNDGRDVEGKNVYRSGLNQLKTIDFECLFDALSRKFGGKWAMVCRFHYHVEKMVDWEELEQNYPGRFFNGNKNDDMANYLACADFLMSDSSSCMCDYALTGKPCFIFFPDYDHYEKIERGFYFDLRTFPFPIAKDFMSFIKNIEQFDSKTYKNKIDFFLNQIGSADDGNASERAVDFIQRYLTTGFKEKK